MDAFKMTPGRRRMLERIARNPDVGVMFIVLLSEGPRIFWALRNAWLIEENHNIPLPGPLFYRITDAGRAALTEEK